MWRDRLIRVIYDLFARKVVVVVFVCVCGVFSLSWWSQEGFSRLKLTRDRRNVSEQPFLVFFGCFARLDEKEGKRGHEESLLGIQEFAVNSVSSSNDPPPTNQTNLLLCIRIWDFALHARYKTNCTKIWNQRIKQHPFPFIKCLLVYRDGPSVYLEKTV